MATRKKDWTGQRVGNLTVIGEAPTLRKWYYRWWVRCDCGKEKSIDAAELRQRQKAGRAMCDAWCKIAGENIRRAVTKHAACNTPEYKCWTRMKNRCYQKSNPSYPRYGGIGLTVSDEWRKDFLKFLEDMGPMPAPNMSVDRIDNSKGYFKENCRWATPKEQANNRCDNRIIDTPWGKMTISQASNRSGIPPTILSQRLRAKKDKGLFRPVRRQNEKVDSPWGKVTVIEGSKLAGIDKKLVWSRLARGITDPERLFAKADLRLEPLPKKGKKSV